jgi:hypothetical protein
MNKTQKILLISFSALFALLLVALFVAAGVSVAKNGMQGLVGELFGDVYFPPLIEWGSSAPPSQIELPEESISELPTVEMLEPEIEQTVAPETERETNKLQEMFGFERTEALEEIFDFDRTHEPTNQEVQSIRKGMSYAEVIAIAGKPHGYYECGEFEDGDYTVFWCTQEGYEPYSLWICFRLPDAYESEQERWSNAWVSDIKVG